MPGSHGRAGRRWGLNAGCSQQRQGSCCRRVLGVLGAKDSPHGQESRASGLGAPCRSVCSPGFCSCTEMHPPCKPPARSGEPGEKTRAGTSCNAPPPQPPAHPIAPRSAFSWPEPPARARGRNLGKPQCFCVTCTRALRGPAARPGWMPPYGTWPISWVFPPKEALVLSRL